MFYALASAGEGYLTLERHFTLAGGVTECRDAAKQCAASFSPPHELLVRISETNALEILCCCILWFLFLLLISSPAANEALNVVLLLTLSLVLTLNLAGAEPLAVFLRILPLLRENISLSSVTISAISTFLLQPHSSLTAREVLTFLSFNPDPKNGLRRPPRLA